MTGDLQDFRDSQASQDSQDARAHALETAAAWWQNRPFPYTADGYAYLCTSCGRQITQREGTSLIGPEMRCADCTLHYFGGPPAYVAPQPYVPPPQGYAPPPQAYVPRRPRRRLRRRTWLYIAATVAVVAGLVAGLLVWAPWRSDVPGTPRNVAVAAATATTATVSWTRPTGGPGVDKYLILRNGVQVAAVTGDQLSYTDSGLRPGGTYRYRVIAVSGEQRSTASASVVAVTRTPSPVAAHTAGIGTTWVAVAWSAPPEVPMPTRYYVLVDGVDAASVPGTVTSYRITGLTPATDYRLQVAAGWGSARSFPTGELAATTRTPLLSAARLSGTLSLRVRIVSTGGGNLRVGRQWSESWTFDPVCASGACSVSLNGDFTPPGFTWHSFKMTLHRSGRVYTGRTHAHITHCGVAPLVSDVSNTVTVRITVKSGYLSGSDWLAKRFVGSLRIDAPYTQAGMYYCPAQTVTTALTSTG